MRRSLIALAAIGFTLPAAASSPPQEFVAGHPIAVFSQQPPSSPNTYFLIPSPGNKRVIFCSPTDGSNYAIDMNNISFNVLKTALDANKAVQVRVAVFGSGQQIKHCIISVSYSS